MRIIFEPRLKTALRKFLIIHFPSAAGYRGGSRILKRVLVDTNWPPNHTFITGSNCPRVHLRTHAPHRRNMSECVLPPLLSLDFRLLNDEQASVRQELCSMYRPNIISRLCVWAVQ